MLTRFELIVSNLTMLMILNIYKWFFLIYPITLVVFDARMRTYIRSLGISPKRLPGKEVFFRIFFLVAIHIVISVVVTVIYFYYTKSRTRENLCVRRMKWVLDMTHIFFFLNIALVFCDVFDKYWSFNIFGIAYKFSSPSVNCIWLFVYTFLYLIVQFPFVRKLMLTVYADANEYMEDLQKACGLDTHKHNQDKEPKQNKLQSLVEKMNNYKNNLTERITKKKHLKYQISDAQPEIVTEQTTNNLDQSHEQSAKVDIVENSPPKTESDPIAKADNEQSGPLVSDDEINLIDTTDTRLVTSDQSVTSHIKEADTVQDNADFPLGKIRAESESIAKPENEVEKQSRQTISDGENDTTADQITKPNGSNPK